MKSKDPTNHKTRVKTVLIIIVFFGGSLVSLGALFEGYAQYSGFNAHLRYIRHPTILRYYLRSGHTLLRHEAIGQLRYSRTNDLSLIPELIDLIRNGAVDRIDSVGLIRDVVESDPISSGVYINDIFRLACQEYQEQLYIYEVPWFKEGFVSDGLYIEPSAHVLKKYNRSFLLAFLNRERDQAEGNIREYIDKLLRVFGPPLKERQEYPIADGSK